MRSRHYKNGMSGQRLKTTSIWAAQWDLHLRGIPPKHLMRQCPFLVVTPFGRKQLHNVCKILTAEAPIKLSISDTLPPRRPLHLAEVLSERSACRSVESDNFARDTTNVSLAVPDIGRQASDEPTAPSMISKLQRHPEDSLDDARFHLPAQDPCTHGTSKIRMPIDANDTDDLLEPWETTLPTPIIDGTASPHVQATLQIPPAPDGYDEAQYIYTDGSYDRHSAPDKATWATVIYTERNGKPFLRDWYADFVSTDMQSPFWFGANKIGIRSAESTALSLCLTGYYHATSQPIYRCPYRATSRQWFLEQPSRRSTDAKPPSHVLGGMDTPQGRELRCQTCQESFGRGRQRVRWLLSSASTSWTFTTETSTQNICPMVCHGSTWDSMGMAQVWWVHTASSLTESCGGSDAEYRTRPIQTQNMVDRHTEGCWHQRWWMLAKHQMFAVQCVHSTQARSCLIPSTTIGISPCPHCSTTRNSHARSRDHWLELHSDHFPCSLWTRRMRDLVQPQSEHWKIPMEAHTFPTVPTACPTRRRWTFGGGGGCLWLPSPCGVSTCATQIIQWRTDSAVVADSTRHHSQTQQRKNSPLLHWCECPTWWNGTMGWDAGRRHSWYGRWMPTMSLPIHQCKSPQHVPGHSLWLIGHLARVGAPAEGHQEWLYPCVLLTTMYLCGHLDWQLSGCRTRQVGPHPTVWTVRPLPWATAEYPEEDQLWSS